MNSPTKAGRTGTWATESLHRSGVGRERRAEPGLTVEPPAWRATRQPLPDARTTADGATVSLSAPARRIVELDLAARANSQIGRLGGVPDRTTCRGNPVAQQLIDDRPGRDHAFERREVVRPDFALRAMPVDARKRSAGQLARVGIEGPQFPYRQGSKRRRKP